MNKSLSVYLAGPIEGMILEDATGWRKYATQYLGEVGIDTFNPMAGKEQIVGPGEMILYEKLNPQLAYLHKPDSVFYRDVMNIRKSDIVLVDLTVKPESMGTPWEMGFAYGLGKTIVVVSAVPAVIGHPFVSMSSVIFETMDDALNFITSSLF